MNHGSGSGRETRGIWNRLGCGNRQVSGQKTAENSLEFARTSKVVINHGLVGGGSRTRTCSQAVPRRRIVPSRRGRWGWPQGSRSQWISTPAEKISLQDLSPLYPHAAARNRSIDARTMEVGLTTSSPTIWTSSGKNFRARTFYPVGATKLQFDWQQLRRWGIDEARLWLGRRNFAVLSHSSRWWTA
jgi:hypothetical protein